MKKTKPPRRKPPKTIGASSYESAPKVMVRAGKHYVCSACGTWVEIPADVVGQMVYVPSPADEPPPRDPLNNTRKAPSEVLPRQTPEATPPDVPTPVAPTPPAKASAAQNTQNPGAAAEEPLRQPTPQTPPRKRAVPRTIDGLQVPSGRRLDHAFAWVRFHMQVLDRQDSEIKQLKKLLRQRRRQFRRTPATDHSYDDRPIAKTKRPSNASPPVPCPKQTPAEKPIAVPPEFPLPAAKHHAPPQEPAASDGPTCRGREPP